MSAALANGLASPHRRRAALVLLLALLVVVLVVHAAPTPPAFWTVHVGQTPGALAVDARYGRLLVADSADRSVHLLDARSGALLATIPLGTAPAALALDETHGRAFTLNGCAVSPSIAALCSAGGSSMSVLDLRRGTLLDTVGMAPGAAALAVDEQADRVLVAHADGTVGLLAAASGRRLRTIAVGGSTVAIAAASRLGHVFLSSDDVGTGQGRVLMLDSATGTLLSTQPVGPSAGLVLSDARAGRVLAAGETGLRVLDARTGRMLRDIAGGGLPLAIDGGDGRALIATQGHLRLLATRDGALVGPTLDRGGLSPVFIDAVAVDALGGRFYVVGHGPTDRTSPTALGYLAVLDSHTGRLLRQLALPELPLAVAVDPLTHRAFIAGGAAEAGRSDGGTRPTEWLRRLLPWLPLPATPPAAGGTVTVVDTTRL